MPSPTVTLSILALRSVGQSTVAVPDTGHFRAILGSQKGLSELLNGSLPLSVTVGLACHSEQSISRCLYHSPQCSFAIV
jgi:hypothetical protein